MASDPRPPTQPPIGPPADADDLERELFASYRDGVSDADGPSPIADARIRRTAGRVPPRRRAGSLAAAAGLVAALGLALLVARTPVDAPAPPAPATESSAAPSAAAAPPPNPVRAAPTTDHEIALAESRGIAAVAARAARADLEPRAAREAFADAAGRATKARTAAEPERAADMERATDRQSAADIESATDMARAARVESAPGPELEERVADDATMQRAKARDIAASTVVRIGTLRRMDGTWWLDVGAEALRLDLGTLDDAARGLVAEGARVRASIERGSGTWTVRGLDDEAP